MAEIEFNEVILVYYSIFYNTYWDDSIVLTVAKDFNIKIYFLKNI